MLKKFFKVNKFFVFFFDMLGMFFFFKLMIRFYLLGWGVFIIICGIIVVVSLDYYLEFD